MKLFRSSGKAAGTGGLTFASAYAGLGKIGLREAASRAKEQGRGKARQRSRKVKTKDLALFFRQFSVMIDAGLPLVQCLEILSDNQESEAFKQTLAGVRGAVEGGSTLANALRQYPKVFDDLTTNMMEAGEAGGILDLILQRLAQYMEKAVKLRSAVKSALIYPVSVVSIAILIVGALLKWVVPIFANLFAGMDVALPLATRFVIGLSAFVSSTWWFFLVGIAALIYGVKMARKRPRWKYASDKVLLGLPVAGLLLRKIAVARFTRTLGTLITSGVPILDGLAITARTAGNAVLEEAILKVRKAVEEGGTIVDPLRECGLFPAMVTQMIGVGEATGAIDSMLQKIADFYEDEVDAATRDMLAMLEPLIIAILGVTIGGIVISLYMPLFAMISKLAG